MDWLRRWAEDRPFLLAVLLMTVLVVPGFARTEQAMREAREAAETARATVATTKRQQVQNTEVIDCLIPFVKKQTDALQDRDAVNTTIAATEVEMWTEIHRWLKTQRPGEDRTPMLEAIEKYRAVTQRLLKHQAIRPYPEISRCLKTAIQQAVERTYDAIVLALHPSRTCWGRPIEMFGTNRDDTITGTDRSDVIATFRGSDVIRAGKGNDYVCSGRGPDTINGGGDFDRANGGRGDDFCVQVEIQRSCG